MGCPLPKAACTPLRRQQFPSRQTKRSRGRVARINSPSRVRPSVRSFIALAVLGPFRGRKEGRLSASAHFFCRPKNVSLGRARARAVIPDVNKDRKEKEGGGSGYFLLLSFVGLGKTRWPSLPARLARSSDRRGRKEGSSELLSSPSLFFSGRMMRKISMLGINSLPHYIVSPGNNNGEKPGGIGEGTMRSSERRKRKAS